MSDSINKTINIDVNVESQNLDKAAKGVEKVTKATENHTKSLEHNRKGVLENGGAMGLLGAATGGLAMDFKDAVEAIEMTGISLKGLRGAIIATGIGALAIILLELITNWDKWKGVIDGTTAALERNKKAISDLELEQSNINLLKSRELAIAEAQGATEEHLYLLRKAENQRQIDDLNDQITAQERLQKDLNLTSDEEMKNNEEWTKAEEKKKALYIEVNNLITKGMAMPFAEEKRLRDISLAEQKKTNEEKLANDKKYLSESIAFLKKYYDLIDASGKELVNFNNAIFGKTYTDLTKLHSITGDLFKANEEIQKKIVETNKKIKAASGDKEYQALVKQYRALATQQAETSEKAFAGFELARKIQNQILQSNEDEIANNDRIIEQYDELNKLKLEEFRLNNKLFEYEKSADNRLDNSNKYAEIEERINATYELRVEIIKKTKLAEREILQSKYDALKSDKDLLESDETLIAQKQKGRKDFSDDEKKRLKELELEMALTGKTETGLMLDKLTKQKDLEVQMSQTSVEIAKNTSDLRVELATETSNKLLGIDQNYWDEQKALREEALDREQQYKAASMGIATETQNFLDALIANGHQKGKKDAENALALRKVIGVANVVITGQEEIRGIWANPSLTALPDTGVVTKGLLTAAAVARAGLSIATILAQKLTGGSSGNNTSSGTANAPQASFNIVGSSTTNQLAATIASQQQQPVKAYVVGTDMTTQQALDRNITNNATFL